MRKHAHTKECAKLIFTKEERGGRERRHLYHSSGAEWSLSVLTAHKILFRSALIWL